MDFNAILSPYGLAGAIIFVLAGVCVFLYRKVEKLTDKLFDLQEARRTENLETQKTLTSTMSTFSQTTQLLLDKIVTVQGRKK